MLTCSLVTAISRLQGGRAVVTVQHAGCSYTGEQGTRGAAGEWCATGAGVVAGEGVDEGACGAEWSRGRLVGAGATSYD